MVRQLNPAVATADIQSATLELSTDSLTWTSVAEFGQGTSPIGASPDEWVAILPTQGLPSGDVELRATFITLAGRSTPPVRRLRLNQPPVAVASGQVRDYEITWDASASTDPDGTITTYEWDFGDGTKGTGVSPTHTYPYLPGTYTVTLLVTDNTGLTAMTAVEVVVTAQEQVYIQSAVTCVCTGMELRSTQNQETLGPRADGSADWPINRGQNGSQLGGFTTPTRHFAFEVNATVRGNPALCQERQLVRATFTLPGMTERDCTRLSGVRGFSTRFANGTCFLEPQNSGTPAVDLDFDGQTDLSTPTVAGFGSTSWVPDGYGAATSLYDQPYDFKRYHTSPGVIWFDAPGTGYPGGSLDASFLGFLRGTDGTYCYARYDVTVPAGNGIPTATVGASGAGAATLPL